MLAAQERRRELWRQLIAQQGQSRLSVRAFCKQQRTSEHSFHQWRKRLADQVPMKFELVETRHSAPADVIAVEVILAVRRAVADRAGRRRRHAATGAERIARAAMIVSMMNTTWRAAVASR